MRHAVLRSLAAQTFRLVSDLTAPLAAGLSRMVARASLPRPAVRTAAIALIVTAGIVAAAAFRLFGNAPASAPDGAAGEPLRSGPVKIVDAAPRGENCEDQVWPYIEQRCLRRAATPPPAESPPRAAPPQAPAATVAPAAPSEPQVPAVAEAPAEPEPQQGRDDGQAAQQAALLAGAASGAAAIQAAKPERRAERRRGVRRSARRPAFRLPILGLRF